MSAEICGPEWWEAYRMRVRGEHLPPNKDRNIVDGWITADAEAHNCTEMCDLANVDDPEDPKHHNETCGMNFKPLA